MFFGFNLNEILMFPIKDQENRKHFYVGILVSLLAFIIPIAPQIILFGYSAQIAKQILNGESPRMVAWDDWGKLFKDGLKVFGARFITGLPILLFFVPFIFVSFLFPFLIESGNSQDVEAFFPIYFLIMFGSFCFIFPISLALTVIIPAAEMYVIEKDDFTALFKFSEWWKIFRANLSGFIAAFGIYFIVSFIVSFAIQMVISTIVLACLAIILLPAMAIYLILIMHATGAIAYKEGQAKLASQTSETNASA